jgi:DNA-binding IclR family transcriptional regulator
VLDGALAGYETAAQVAERLGIDASQVHRYCDTGR